MQSFKYQPSEHANSINGVREERLFELAIEAQALITVCETPGECMALASTRVTNEIEFAILCFDLGSMRAQTMVNRQAFKMLMQHEGFEAVPENINIAIKLLTTLHDIQSIPTINTERAQA
jgi:hypothetical protein